MPNYGRYFEVRIPPVPEHRLARYISPAAVIPIGAPIVDSGVRDADGSVVVALATAAEAHTAAGTPLQSGKHGIAIFEHAYNAFAGMDPDLTVPSDFSDIPAGSRIQCVAGTECKFVLRNIPTDTVFMNTRTYDDSRTFVAPLDLSTLAIGDTLSPGVGSNAAGFWAETPGGDTPWLRVVNIDTDLNEVEVQVLFG